MQYNPRIQYVHMVYVPMFVTAFVINIYLLYLLLSSFFYFKLLEDNKKAMLREQEQLACKRQENLEYGKALKSIMEQHHINKMRELELQYQQHQYDLKEIEKRFVP